MATRRRERKPSPPSTTFRAAVERYIAESGREQYLDRIVMHFGPNITIGEIDAAAIDDAVRKIGPHLSENSAKSTIRNPIRIVLNHAFDTGRKRGPGRLPQRWLDPDEAEQLIEAASRPERIGLRDPQRRTLQKIAFMLGTGAMPGEVITIKGSDLDRNTGT